MSKLGFENDDSSDTSDTLDDYNTSDIDITTENNHSSNNNYNVDIHKIKFSKIAQIIIGVLIFNCLFATVSYYSLYDEISNATHFIDFYYFGLVTLTSTGYGDMAPTTIKARTFISLYLLFIYSFMLSFTL